MNPRIAYFSMEIALEPSIPTYSGGLGILAGDTVRSAADLEYPMVAVSLAHRAGYFRQRLDAQGNQFEEADRWSPEQRLELCPTEAEVEIEGRRVRLRAWRYDVRGASGGEVPVYLLDSDLPENDDGDRRLTDALYGGDTRYRLAQEAILGLGGASLIGNLFADAIHSYHLNEGHSALLTLSLLEDRLSRRGAEWPDEADLEAVRRRCIFTTHTPVPAGHDRFSRELVAAVLGGRRAELLGAAGDLTDDGMNMTHVALRNARYVNGVAMQHGKVSRTMFPRHSIHAITNGVHATTWVSAPFARLFDEHVPEWRRDNVYLRYVESVPLDEIAAAHRASKIDLIDHLRLRTGVELDSQALMLGFARRAASYKRADLIVSDLERLRSIARNAGPIQILYAGKSHPHDGGGRDMIRSVVEGLRALDFPIRAFYLENYDMELAARIVAGVDLWLNTPEPPLEASGTSGMKAALNGVPSLSTLDGWWLEGCIEGVTGWAIGEAAMPADRAADAQALYEKLEQITALYYGDPQAYLRVRRSAISLNGSFFNTQRMVAQYGLNAYFREDALGGARIEAQRKPVHAIA